MSGKKKKSDKCITVPKKECKMIMLIPFLEKHPLLHGCWERRKNDECKRSNR